jgi:hypothetical protein
MFFPFTRAMDEVATTESKVFPAWPLAGGAYRGRGNFVLPPMKIKSGVEHQFSAVTLHSVCAAVARWPGRAA